MSRFALSFVLTSAIGSLVGLATAHADAISPEPTDCVDGSRAEFCHGPPTCRALTCTSDADCEADAQCVEAQLCVAEHGCGGRLGEPRYTHVESVCNAAGGCDPDSFTTCETVRVCRTGARVDGGLTDSGVDSGGLDSGGLDSGGLDSGGTDTGAPMDAASSADSGGVDSGEGMDSGNDTGSDAGPPPTTGGGCCSAMGQRSLPLTVTLGSILALVLGRRRLGR